MQSIDDLSRKPFKNAAIFQLQDIAIVATLILILYQCRTHSYLLFHSVSELFSVVVAVCIFSIAWAARRTIDNGSLIIIGTAYLFVGFVDLLHMLTYKGMSILHSDTNTPTQLWVGARYLESVALFMAPFFMRKRVSMPLAVLAGACITAFFFYSVFVMKFFPDCFVEGQGLTTFKIVSEFIISGILLAAIFNIHVHINAVDRGIFTLVVFSILLAIVQESLFTLYSNPYDLFNAAGHVLKILSFYLLFKVFFITGVQTPARTLFKALSDSEERYRSLMELSPNAILINRRNRIVKANPAAVELFKAGNPGRLIGKTPLELFHPSCHATILERLKRLEAGQPVPFDEEMITCLDGSHCHVSVGASPIVDSEGTSIQVILRDISEQKRSQTERQTTIDFLKITNECSGTLELVQRALSFFHRLSACETVGLRLRDGVNFPYYEMRGFPEQFAVQESPDCDAEEAGLRECLCGKGSCGRFQSSKPFFEIKGSVWSNSAPAAVSTPTVTETRTCACDRCRAQGYQSVAIITLHTGNGTLGLLHLNDTARDRFTPQGIAFWERLADYFAVAIEKVRLKALAERRAEQLAIANKEIEAFSYSVAHDLRNPLWSLSVYTDMLVEDYAGSCGQEFGEILQKMKNGTRRMNAIIDDMLTLAKLSRQEMALSEVDFSEMARQVIGEYREGQPGRRVETVIHEGLKANADRRLMNLAFGNLLGNAWKYTAKTAQPRIEFGAMDTDGRRVYFIKDNGAGFDMARADDLFTPFKRLHSQEEFAGTGVGLAIVQRAISRHGGHIWAEAEPGNGATFFFTLG